MVYFSFCLLKNTESHHCIVFVSSSFLLEERCRFLSVFSISTADVELPGEFLMPKSNIVCKVCDMDLCNMLQVCRVYSYIKICARLSELKFRK